MIKHEEPNTKQVEILDGGQSYSYALVDHSVF